MRFTLSEERRMRTRLSQFTGRWVVGALGSLLASVVSATSLLAQGGGTITGKVTDAKSGFPLSGVNVQLDGTLNRVLTADDGGYRIVNVTAGSYTLVVRRFGFAGARQPVTIAENQALTADFNLEPSAISLDAVVVTGSASGGQRRTIGNAVATISAPDALAQSAATDLSSLLNARVPGAVIGQPTGRLGAGSGIVIRGRSSIGLGNSPLIYIDGVRVTNSTGTGPSGGGLAGQNASVAGRLNDISPEDIETIEVIKGPAAATIYGTEASSGVIQIITKRGTFGSSPQFTLVGSGGPIWFRDAAGRMPTNFARDSSGNIVTWNAVEQEEARGTPLFETGQMSQLNGSFSGGRNDVRYYLSGLYEKDQGIEPNNSLHQVSVHANLDLALSDKLNLGSSLNFVDLRNHLGVDGGASVMFASVFGHNLVFPRARGFGLNFLPEVTQHLWDNSQDVRRFTASGRLEHNPIQAFTQRLIVGIDQTGDDSRSLERFAPPDLAVLLPPATAAGRIRQTLRDAAVITADYVGTAKFNPMPSLSSSSSVGGQLFRNESNSSVLGGTGFPGAGIETVSGVAVPDTPAQSQILNTTIGAYAEQKFGWNDRLYLTGAIRVDNNSAFGEDFKWVTYPKVDASWVVSEEPFWGWRGVVRSLRLRAAYGESGRQPNVFSALRTFTPVQGPAGVSAVTPGSIGNIDLKPERGKELETGFEAEIFDRLSLDFTYFSKKTEDVIINQAVAPSTGFAGSRPVNLGRVDNSGIELLATVSILRNARFDWEVRGSYATNRDEIKDLGGLPSVIASYGQHNKVGYPIGGFYSKRVVSADRAANGTATNVLCDGGPGVAPVACAQAPFLFIGTPTPKRSGSVANTLRIGRNLRFFALMDFKQGNKQLNATDLLRCTGGLGAGLCEANYRPENYSPVYLAETVGNALNQGIVHQWVQNTSFAKLREVSGTYTLPNGWIPGASQASFTLAARELATWTPYDGIDPEVSSAGGGGTTAQDQALYPPLTRIIATLSIRF
jgi:TonB-linked SusC/RagA family outer membrane protein